VPALSGIYFLLANNPAIANGPMIGRKRLNNNTIPGDIQKVVVAQTFKSRTVVGCTKYIHTTFPP
jgi:hypothetical protein